MKYMMMFWVDETATATADEDAAIMIAVKSWVEQMTERGVMVHGGALRSAGEAAEFDTRVPHWFGAAGTEPAELLVLFGPQGERMHVRARPRERGSERP